jgi:hypothetical protein
VAAEAEAAPATSGLGPLAIAAMVVLALGACGVTTSTGPSARPGTSCESAFVDWLYVVGKVKCSAAKDVASAIFRAEDGNERTSFMKQDFSPLPTVEVAGVGYLPTRIQGLWRCRYDTRRSSYGVATGARRFDAIGSPWLVQATCRAKAGVVVMTTAIHQGENRRKS